MGKKDLIHHIDATGTANTAYSGAQTIHSDLNAGSYRLRDLTKGNGVKTLHGETGRVGTDYTSTSANWTLPGTDIAALDAHFGVSKTYEFYKVNFNRDSYDNYGSALTSYVNDDHYTDNAYWNGTAMYFCKRSNGTPGGVTSIDVTGHELTHGFTQSASDLAYVNESGAMNESISDIMGKSVQFWAKPNDINWKLGNSMNWIIRDMANPNAYQQPDTYNGTYWYGSDGDVHTNSGVGNFMFYLLVTGGSGTNDKGNAYSVSGIGLAKADQIIYRTNNMYLTPTAKYANWRTACIRAATDLYGAYSNEVVQVQNAWYAVGVGEKPVVCTSVLTPTNLTATNVTANGATISWSSTGANSYNLQWKTAAATTFTTVTGIVNNFYNLTGLTAGTSYQYKVQSVCGTALSAYSPLSAFTTPSPSVTYCASKGNVSFEYINRVALRTINNTSGNNNGYGNFTNLSTTLTTGTANTISLYPGFLSATYVEYWTVFIDYNKDGDLADAGETVTTGSGNGTVTTTFTVPSTAKNGATRMRIQMKYGSPASTNPCATLVGEVEDYTVNISGGTTFAPFAVAEELNIPGIKISPNPVTEAGATITYTIAKAGKVTLRIADMYGRVVNTISAGTQTKGTYTIPLNNKEKLPAGNYIIAV